MFKDLSGHALFILSDLIIEGTVGRRGGGLSSEVCVNSRTCFPRRDVSRRKSKSGYLKPMPVFSQIESACYKK